LKELTSNGTTFKLLAGRYGPYVTDGTTNASIPKSTNPESVTCGSCCPQGAQDHPQSRRSVNYV